MTGLERGGGGGLVVDVWWAKDLELGSLLSARFKVILKDRQLLIRGVWEWFHKIGTGSLSLNSILSLCEL